MASNETVLVENARSRRAISYSYKLQVVQFLKQHFQQVQLHVEPSIWGHAYFFGEVISPILTNLNLQNILSGRLRGFRNYGFISNPFSLLRLYYTSIDIGCLLFYLKKVIVFKVDTFYVKALAKMQWTALLYCKQSEILVFAGASISSEANNSYHQFRHSTDSGV